MLNIEVDANETVRLRILRQTILDNYKDFAGLSEAALHRMIITEGLRTLEARFQGYPHGDR
jgi:hypothetical protein